MFDKELSSFLTKFHTLRRAGFTAHLDIDTHAGKSWVGLRVMLGPDQPQNVPNVKSKSPSYFTRQERRKAARTAEQPILSGDVAEKASSTNDVPAAEVGNTKVQRKNVSVNQNNAEKAIIEFNCELCEFTSTRESGVSIHMSGKHTTIEQLDGQSDRNEAEDDEYESQFKDEEEDMEHYLRTGVINDESDFFWFFLIFVIDKAGKPGDELSVALDARKRAIELKYPGTYKKRLPWDKIFIY